MITTQQADTAARLTGILLALDDPAFAGLQLTTRPLELELAWKNSVALTLYACEKDGTDVTIRVSIAEDGFQAWTRRRYPAETFTTMGAPLAAYPEAADLAETDAALDLDIEPAS